MEQEIKVGDRVSRKPVNNFKHQSNEKGIVIEIIEGWSTGRIVKRCRIKWDNKASTGQQHSTIQMTFLRKI